MSTDPREATVPASPELLERIAARDYCDFPTAWLIAEEGVVHTSDRCSYVTQHGALLCDCGAVEARWSELRRALEATE